MRLAFATAAVAAGLRLEETATPMPLEALKSQMAEVQAEIHRAGRVTPGVYSTLQKLLSLVTSVVEPAIYDAHGADQLLVLSLHREIMACDATYKRFLAGTQRSGHSLLSKMRGEWAATAATAETLKAKFAACLDERDVLVRHNNSICCQQHAACGAAYGDCDLVKLSEGFAGCDYKTHTGAECFREAQRLVAPLEGYFRSQDAKFEALRVECSKFTAATKAKVAECAQLSEAVNAEVGHSNEAAGAVNQGNEQLIASCKAACAGYQQCRDGAEAEYHRIVGPCEGDAYSAGSCVKGREADRKNEWEATQTIKCMLEAYCAGGHLDEDELEKCKGSISTYQLVITYPVIPETVPCEVPTCEDCPGCDECVDRPYYQYEVPCYATPLPDAPTCLEQPECPEWCADQRAQPAPAPAADAPAPGAWAGVYRDPKGVVFTVAVNGTRVRVKSKDALTSGRIVGGVLELKGPKRTYRGRLEGESIRFKSGQVWTRHPTTTQPPPPPTHDFSGLYVDPHGNTLRVAQQGHRVTISAPDGEIEGHATGQALILKPGAVAEGSVKVEVVGDTIALPGGENWTRWDMSSGPPPTTTPAPVPAAARDLNGALENLIGIASDCTWSCSASDCAPTCQFLGSTNRDDCWFLRKRCDCGCPADLCAADTLTCDDVQRTVLRRDPLRGCQFPECPRPCTLGNPRGEVVPSGYTEPFTPDNSWFGCSHYSCTCDDGWLSSSASGFDCPALCTEWEQDDWDDEWDDDVIIVVDDDDWDSGWDDDWEDDDVWDDDW